MIVEEIQQLAEKFAAQWNTVFKRSAEFQLDFSWPSVGTLDLLTYSLRFQKKLSQVEQELICGASAYLAVMAHECWASYLETDVTVGKSRGKDLDVLISATGQGLLKEGRFSISISQSLRRILKELPEKFAIYPEVFRELDASQNYLSSFGLGVLSGYSMYGKGSWKNCSEEQFAPNLKIAQRILAGSSAKYYQRVFPEEPLGADETLYLANLVLPPMMYEEMFPACRATSALVHYLKQLNISEEKMRPLAENLATSPDEQISAAGFALATALIDEKPSPRLCAVALSKESTLPFLRHAVVTARFLLDRPQGVPELLEKKEYDKAKALLGIERQLGLASILKIPDRFLENEDIAPLYASLLWFNPVQAKMNLGELRKNATSLDPELELQDIFLDIGLGYQELAEESLEELNQKYKVQSFSNPALYQEILGFFALKDNRPDDACKYFSNSFAGQEPEDENYFTSGILFANTLFEQEKFQETLNVAKSLLAVDSYFVPARLGRIAALHKLGREEETKQDIEFLRPFAGMHRAVFAELIHSASSQI